MKIVSLFACVIAINLFSVPPSWSISDDTDVTPAPGRHIGIGLHRMHIHCTGQGAPTVILESGLGGTSLDWVRVQPEVAKFTRVCSYDRSGYGWSERSLLPRTAATIVSELKQLLTYASIPPPYILVGHSLGGFSVQLYARCFSHEVVGLVLIDSSHPEQFERFSEAGIRQSFVPNRRRFVISNYYQVPDALPKETKPIAQTLALLPDAVRTLHKELQAMPLSAQQLRQAQGYFAGPVAVIAHDGRTQAKNSHAHRLAEVWLVLQTELAASSPQGTLTITANSGHHIHLEQPALVVDAIQALITNSRGKPMQ